MTDSNEGVPASSGTAVAEGPTFQAHGLPAKTPMPAALATKIVDLDSPYARGGRNKFDHHPS